MFPFFWRSLNSSNLKRMSWHPLGGGTMAVEFQHGGVYYYKGVSLSRYRVLVQAHTDGESVGSLFHHLIKQGGYEYQRVS